MRIAIRSASLDGSPLDAAAEVFTGDTALDIVRAMNGATMFSAHRSLDDYMDAVQRSAWDLAGIELHVKGATPAERASALLSSLIDHKLAQILGDDEPLPPTKGERP